MIGWTKQTECYNGVPVHPVSYSVINAKRDKIQSKELNCRTMTWGVFTLTIVKVERMHMISFVMTKPVVDVTCTDEESTWGSLRNAFFSSLLQVRPGKHGHFVGSRSQWNILHGSEDKGGRSFSDMKIEMDGSILQRGAPAVSSTGSELGNITNIGPSQNTYPSGNSRVVNE